MVSQFVSADEVRLLGDLDFDFPEGIHAIGRLDSNSEGLLILTTNKRVTKLLFQGAKPHKRTYLIMVKHALSPESLLALQTGVPIRVSESEYYTTPACDTQIVERPSTLLVSQYEAEKYGEHTWLTMTLYEGKFHQVRKMVQAVRHPCKRLIRLSIEDLELGDLPPGGVKELQEEEFFKLLKIDDWQR